MPEPNHTPEPEPEPEREGEPPAESVIGPVASPEAPPVKRARPNSASGAPAPPSVPPSVAQVKFSLAHARSKVALLVNPRQLGNPVLRHIRHVRTEVSDGVTADFLCGPTTCVLYLSLQYHLLHPRYIYARIRALGRAFRLRLVLVLADVPEHRAPLHELLKLGLVHQVVVVVAGSEREAARYLETFRSYDAKGAEGIQERVAADYSSRLNAALSSIRGVNRTDVSTLAFTFGKFRNLATASQEEIRACPGVGERKVARLYAALHQPFRTDVPWTGDTANAEEVDEIEESVS